MYMGSLSLSVLKGRVGPGHGMFPLTSDLAWLTFSATCLTSSGLCGRAKVGQVEVRSGSAF